jgi:DNA topoisomerase-1
MSSSNSYWYKREGDLKKGFNYYNGNRLITNKKIIDYIKKLRIPPAYTNVKINKNKDAKILAYGFDAKNRKQVIYNPIYIKEQSTKKYNKIIKHSRVFKKLNKIINEDLKNTENIKKKEIAIILYLIINCGFRIGNNKYAKENKSYGLTTLEFRHIKFVNNQIIIDFIGKKGVQNKSICMNDIIYKYLSKKKRQYKATERVFSYKSDDKIINISSNYVNKYLKKISPEITAKDLRTWCANELFLKFIKDKKILNTKNPIKKAIEMVAEKLHNTSIICKKNYIDPEIINDVEKKINST